MKQSNINSAVSPFWMRVAGIGMMLPLVLAIFGVIPGTASGVLANPTLIWISAVVIACCGFWLLAQVKTAPSA